MDLKTGLKSKRARRLIKRIKSAIPKLTAAAVGLSVLTVALHLAYFGVPILDNMHRSLLRYYYGQDVVKLTNSKGSGGTGFVTHASSGKKIILTNGHVCGLQEDGKIRVLYRGVDYVEKVIAVYQMNDLCAIEAEGLKGSGFGIASSYSYGEKAYSIGHPLLEPLTIGTGELSGKVSVTIMVGINKTEKECTGPTYHLEEAPPMLGFFGVDNGCFRTLPCNASTLIILPGNSGSPVVNIYGNLIGVAFAANEPGTRSYVVPLEAVKDFLGGL